MEHRWGSRIAVDLPVRMSGAGLAGTGVLRNLSVSGGFIETALPLATLALVRIQIPRGRDGNLPPADVWGFVARRTAQGAGIEWCDPESAQTSELAPWNMRALARAGTGSGFSHPPSLRSSQRHLSYPGSG